MPAASGSSPTRAHSCRRFRRRRGDLPATAYFFAAELEGEPDGVGEEKPCWLDTGHNGWPFFHAYHAWAFRRLGLHDNNPIVITYGLESITASELVVTTPYKTRETWTRAPAN